MAKPKSIVFEFVCKQLEQNKDADYATVRAASEAEGYTIYPIMYGRAKAKLGLVEVRPRGARKRELEEKARRLHAVEMTNGSGHQFNGNGNGNGVHSSSEFAARLDAEDAARRNPADFNSLEAVIQAMKSGDVQRERYRTALRRIHSIIEDALAP